MAKAARDTRQPLARFGEHAIDVRVLERDAGRDETFGGVRAKTSASRGVQPSAVRSIGT